MHDKKNNSSLIADRQVTLIVKGSKEVIWLWSQGSWTAGLMSCTGHFHLLQEVFIFCQTQRCTVFQMVCFETILVPKSENHVQNEWWSCSSDRQPFGKILEIWSNEKCRNWLLCRKTIFSLDSLVYDTLLPNKCIIGQKDTQCLVARKKPRRLHTPQYVYQKKSHERKLCIDVGHNCPFTF